MCFVNMHVLCPGLLAPISTSPTFQRVRPFARHHALEIPGPGGEGLAGPWGDRAEKEVSRTIVVREYVNQDNEIKHQT